MARHARRGPSALRLEVLEPRALLSGDMPGTTPALPPDPAASLLVRFVPGASAAAIQAALVAAGAHVVQSFPDGLSLVAADQGADRDAVVRQLRQAPEVVYAEPDATYQAQAPAFVPDDSAFKLQWGLNNSGKVDIDAPQAWSRTTGSSSIIIAVLDSGIDLANPEFAGRIWTNPDASGSAGYAGDVHGWNFVSNTSNVQDDDGHGTHVSGIIAAAGNNRLGVAGVDWNAQIMPLKVLDSNGAGSNEAMILAIDYAVQHGARVINASWGGGAYSQAMADAIRFAGSQGVVFVTAAGNYGTNNDTMPFYPASYRLPNEIAVAAVDESGRLPSFSNYGARTADLAAPGRNVLSTTPGGGYAYLSGTSMAAPFVSGVVALVAGLHPTWNAGQLVQQVLVTTRPLSGLKGKTVTGGILDAARAVGVSLPGTKGAGKLHLAGLSKMTSPDISHPAALLGPGRHQHSVRRSIHPRAHTESLPLTGSSWPLRRAVLQVRPGYSGTRQAATA